MLYKQKKEGVFEQIATGPALSEAVPDAFDHRLSGHAGTYTFLGLIISFME